MKKRLEVLVILLLVIAVLSVGAYAYFSDRQTVRVSLKAASLELGPVIVVPKTLGDNIKPGDSGSFTVDVENAGTISGYYTVKVSDATNLLVFTDKEVSGSIAKGETVPVVFHWSLPLLTDMGTGGQEIVIKILVSLDQVEP
jgi:predicted ribosomally synthesized peptide with SipW-like signal peptide